MDSEKLEKRRQELVKILEACEVLEKSEEWATLKELVFSKSLESIEKQMLVEAQSKEINTKVLYQLQGEYLWANRYNNLVKFADTLKRQLEEVKNRLK